MPSACACPRVLVNPTLAIAVRGPKENPPRWRQEAWEPEQAVAGITYEIGKPVIGEGYHVRIQTRYAPALPSQFGFKSVADAQAFIEAEKAKHRPGRRRKVAA